MSVPNSLAIVFLDDMLRAGFDQFEMLLKEAARLVHEKITLLPLATSREARSDVVDQAPSKEMTGLFEDTPENFRSVSLEKVVGHRGE